MQDLSAYLGMQEWKENLDKFSTLQKQIEQDVKFNPMVLPIQQLKDKLKFLDKLEKKMQQHECQIKQYNIDFRSIYNGIRESRNQCATKLGLMEMFKWGYRLFIVVARGKYDN